MNRYENVFALFFLLIIILFRSNIIIFFNNIFNLFLEKNNYEEAEKLVLEEKIKYLEEEYNNLNNFKEALPKYANYEYLVSRVIYRDNYLNDSKINILGGKDKGVKKGMVVVNEYGMVGVINKVEDKMSEVTILSNATNISVNIRDSYGKLEYKNNKFEVSDISHDEIIRLNDEVYTSTLGNIKEKLYIGKVVSVETNDLEKKIIVESAVDFHKLNYLLIVGDL